MIHANIKKYVLPNVPYVMVLWCFLKLGTAYRMATGAGFGFKLIGMIRTIGPAFADLSPGLNAADWLVGLAGAVIVRLVMLDKSKKAKNSEGMWSMARPGGARRKTSNRL